MRMNERIIAYFMAEMSFPSHTQSVVLEYFYRDLLFNITSWDDFVMGSGTAL